MTSSHALIGMFWSWGLIGVIFLVIFLVSKAKHWITDWLVRDR